METCFFRGADNLFLWAAVVNKTSLLHPFCIGLIITYYFITVTVDVINCAGEYDVRDIEKTIFLHSIQDGKHEARHEMSQYNNAERTDQVNTFGLISIFSILLQESVIIAFSIV